MKYLIIISLAILSSCSGIEIKDRSAVKYNRVQDRYLTCIVKLNNEGLRQELIEKLCDKALKN